MLKYQLALKYSWYIPKAVAGMCQKRFRLPYRVYIYFSIDMLSEGLRDFYQPFYSQKFVPDETFQANVIQAVNRYMPIFQKVTHFHFCHFHVSFIVHCNYDILFS